MVMIPKVTDVQVIPVAGYDSMLLTLSGAHYPYFTRNIVIITDDSGNRGIGEIHGGDLITKSLNSFKNIIIGRPITEYRTILNDMKKQIAHPSADKGAGIQQLNISNLQYVVHAEAAIECALLDLYGKFVNLPMCDIIGSGRQRDAVEMLGYLFYIGDYTQTDLPYIQNDDNSDAWGKIRRKKTLTVEGIVEQAKAAKERYGFRCFKLKGGVLSGKEEMQAVQALHQAFPDARINLDPNGAWTLDEAISLTQKYGSALTYAEDPCGPENGFSGREVLSYYKNATNKPVATNMIATDWKQLYPALMMKSVDIVLADPHFWGIEGSLRVANILNDWGLTWGSHSNNHFDITLALYAQVSAAAPGNITPIDTHFIWQDGQQLCDNALKIREGEIKIPQRPGLGIDINDTKLAAAHKLYERLSSHDRDDAKAMQYLIPHWTFDPKTPTLLH